VRRLAALALLAAAALVGRRRRSSARRERVRLFYADGSSVTLERGAPAADRLVALARQAL
jgi:hypothetical protein